MRIGLSNISGGSYHHVEDLVMKTDVVRLMIRRMIELHCSQDRPRPRPCCIAAGFSPATTKSVLVFRHLRSQTNSFREKRSGEPGQSMISVSAHFRNCISNRKLSHINLNLVCVCRRKLRPTLGSRHGPLSTHWSSHSSASHASNLITHPDSETLIKHNR